MQEETFEYLLHAAEVGHWGLCSIDLEANPAHPPAESETLINWKIQRLDIGYGPRPAGGILTVSSKGIEQRFAVPLVGEQVIHVGISTVQIRLQVQGEDTIRDILVQPHVITPEIRLLAPERIVLDEAVTLSWDTRGAVGCNLMVRNGDRLIFQENVPTHGQTELTARALAPLYIHIRAWSRHAHLSETAFAVSEIVMDVNAPPLRIELIDGERVKRGYIGDKVQFEWRIHGATEAFVKSVDRDEKVSAPLWGCLEVEIMDIESEVFLVTAIGLDGASQVAELRAIPRIADLSSISPDLQYLCQAWEG